MTPLTQLPAGMTCAQCDHFLSYCAWNLGVQGHERECRWGPPSQFIPRKPAALCVECQRITIASRDAVPESACCNADVVWVEAVKVPPPDARKWNGSGI